MGLTWNDIDFKTGQLTVNKQWKVVSLTPKEYGFDELKTKNSYRSVSIPPKTLLLQTALILKLRQNY